MICEWCGAVEHLQPIQCYGFESCPHCGGIHYGSFYCPYTKKEKNMSSYSDKVEQLREASMTQTPMPRYQCHKKVWALKIKEIEIVRPTIAELEAILASPEPSDLLGAIITPAEPGFGPFGVPKSYVDKHDPQIGGYFVQYEDGYKSFSPAQAFEEGYTPA